jgi:hypothetical protein
MSQAPRRDEIRGLAVAEGRDLETVRARVEGVKALGLKPALRLTDAVVRVVDVHQRAAGPFR